MPDLPDLHLRELAEEVGQTVRQKASSLSVSTALVVVFMAIAGGGFLYFNKDFFLSWQQATLDLRHLNTAHEHCQEEIAVLKARVAALELKLASN